MRSCSGHTFGPWQESRVRRSSGIPVGGTSDASELATGGPPPPQLGVTTTSAQPMTHVTCVLHYYTMKTCEQQQALGTSGIQGSQVQPRGATPRVPRSLGVEVLGPADMINKSMKAQGPINAA